MARRLVSDIPRTHMWTKALKVASRPKWPHLQVPRSWTGDIMLTLRWTTVVLLVGLGLRVSAAPAPFSRPATPAHPRIVVVTPVTTPKATLPTAFDAAGSIPFFGTMNKGGSRYPETGFTEVLTAAGLDLPGELQANAWSALRAAGYDADVAKVKRNNRSFSPPYLSPEQLPQGDVFGFLDMRIVEYGFRTRSSSTDWRALLQVDARLVAADRKTVLFERTFIYNAPPSTAATAVRVSADSAASWKTTKDIEANPSAAATALRIAAHDVAAAMAKTLQ